MHGHHIFRLTIADKGYQHYQKKNLLHFVKEFVVHFKLIYFLEEWLIYLNTYAGIEPLQEFSKWLIEFSLINQRDMCR